MTAKVVNCCLIKIWSYQFLKQKMQFELVWVVHFWRILHFLTFKWLSLHFYSRGFWIDCESTLLEVLHVGSRRRKLVLSTIFSPIFNNSAKTKIFPNFSEFLTNFKITFLLIFQKLLFFSKTLCRLFRLKILLE